VLAMLALLRVAALLPSPLLRAVPAVMPGRDRKAGSLVELESWVWRAALTRGRGSLTSIRNAFLLRPADASSLRR
jgi:hypothetical protein